MGGDAVGGSVMCHACGGWGRDAHECPSKPIGKRKGETEGKGAVTPRVRGRARVTRGCFGVAGRLATRRQSAMLTISRSARWRSRASSTRTARFGRSTLGSSGGPHRLEEGPDDGVRFRRGNCMEDSNHWAPRPGSPSAWPGTKNAGPRPPWSQPLASQPEGIESWARPDALAAHNLDAKVAGAILRMPSRRTGSLRLRAHSL